MWEDFDNAFKGLLIGGLLVGYRQGIATGAAAEHRRLKSDTEMSYESLSHGDYLRVIDSPESQQVYAELGAFLLKYLK